VEFLDFNRNWVEDDLLLFSGQLVGGNSVYLFRGEWRGHLLENAKEFRGQFLELREGKLNVARFIQRFAIGIISIGSKAETDYAFVGFFRGDVKLGEARERSGDEGKHAGGEGVESAEMADGALARMRRMRFTTSCEVRPAGLSMMMTAFIRGFGNLVIE